MTARPSFTTAPALVLVLAVLPAQTARAQSLFYVDERDLMERIHQDLRETLRDNGPQYDLEPESTHLNVPESAVLLLAATALAGASVIAVPAALYSSVGLGSVLGGSGLITVALNWTAYATMSMREPVVGADPLILDGASPTPDFFLNRKELHYGLIGPSGDIEGGSCLAFFALKENPDGSHDLHYELDACSHDEALPQGVPTGRGDLRIGSEGVDGWDELLGQDLVVAKGSVRLLPPGRRAGRPGPGGAIEAVPLTLRR